MSDFDPRGKTEHEDSDPLADPTGGGWLPEDLGPVIAGEIGTTVEPTLGLIDGGLALFYAGRINVVVGEPGSGKSWAALLVIAQCLIAGYRAVYIDFEDRPDTAVSRLRMLGVTDAMFSGLDYIRPTDSLRSDPAYRRLLLAHVADTTPHVAVIDSVGPAMQLEGVDPNSDPEVTGWNIQLPQAIANLGTCVLMVEHPVKAKDGRGRYAAGSHRKLAVVTGAQYEAVVLHAFSKERAGALKLRCQKDRHGNYYLGQTVAVMKVDPDVPGFATLTADVDADHHDREAELMEKLGAAIQMAPEPMTTRQIREAGKGARGTAIDDAVKALTNGGYIEVERRGNAVIHKAVKPFVR